MLSPTCFFMMMMALMVTSVSAARCPFEVNYMYNRGHQVNAFLYKPSCYKFVRTQMTWLQARRYCRELGADLVTIETSGENGHLTGILKRTPGLHKPILGDYHYFGYWTSGNDNRVEGDWRWATTNARIWKNWNNGEPNNNYRGMLHENCLHLGRPWNWKWSDFFCGDEYQGSICERSGYH